MALDKKQVYSNVKLTWPNAEERDYLLGLMRADGVTCGYADNTPVSEAKQKHVGGGTANIDPAPAASAAPVEAPAGSPGVITDEEAQKIKNASLNLAKTVDDAQKK